MCDEYYYTMHDSGTGMTESYGPFESRKAALDAMWKQAQQVEVDAQGYDMEVDEEHGEISMCTESRVDDYNIISWTIL